MNELAPLFVQMAGVADRMSAKLIGVLSEPDLPRAAELGPDDTTMDTPHRGLLARLLDRGWSRETQAAVEAALLGRFYVRFADHAGDAGRRTPFLVCGTAAATG